MKSAVRLTSAALVFLTLTGICSAASVFMATGISIGPTQTYTWHYTEGDYDIAWNYDIQTDGFTIRNGSIVASALDWASGTNVAEVLIQTNTVLNKNYKAQTNHWLVTVWTFHPDFRFDDCPLTNPALSAPLQMRV